MLDKLIARTKNTFNRAHIKQEPCPVEVDVGHQTAAPPTKMGYFLRSLRRGADSQPAEEVAKPRKLQKKQQPRVPRAKSSESRPDSASLSQPALPAQPRARSANADDDSITTPKNVGCPKPMKEIGEYPSAAEYRSVGLKHSVQDVVPTMSAHLAFLSDWEAIANTPAALVASDSSVSPSPRENDAINGSAPTGLENSASLKGSVESVLEEIMIEEALGVDLPPTKPAASPAFQTVGSQTVLSSVSPMGTPATADESMTDLVLTVPDTHITAPDMGTQSPPITSAADGMVSGDEKTTRHDFVAMLNTLPTPTSNVYDVIQLKRVLEIAISHAHKDGDVSAALSLVYFWSEISGDEFKLSLIHNIGRGNVDHNLELALKAMLRHSVEDARKWHDAYLLERTQSLLRQSSESNGSLAKSPGAEPLGQTPFRATEIYRETTGPRLEEAFLTGKSNTAPLKRPRKPVPVNENSFKRQREREEDPTVEESLRGKRARFATTSISEDGVLGTSAIRPQRGPKAEDKTRDESVLQGQPSRHHSLSTEGAAADEVQTTDEVQTAVAAPYSSSRTRPQRAAKARQLQQSQGQKPKQAKKGGRAPASRAQSVPVDDANHDISISISSQTPISRESSQSNLWSAGYTRRALMNSSQLLEPPENMDECRNCDTPGELLCCDTCENALHFHCVSPKLDPKKPPEGEWHCVNCRTQSATAGLSRKGTRKKEVEYLPPGKIRNYFVGVGERVVDTGTWRPDLNLHYYREVPHIPRLTNQPSARPATPSYNDPAFYRRFDNGKVILCSRCGSSASDRPIIRCDYCESRFHLDCLEPPLAIPPNPFDGWMCPRHVRPDEITMSKVVEGRVQERRVRRPKRPAADVDIDTTDDFRETNFDEDWRESRDRLPAGDIILNFVTAVKQKKENRIRDFCDKVRSAAFNLVEHAIGDHLAAERINRDITTAIEDMRTGKKASEQYDAASTLLDMLHGRPVPEVAPATDEPLASISTHDSARSPSRAPSSTPATGEPLASISTHDSARSPSRAPPSTPATDKPLAPISSHDSARSPSRAPSSTPHPESATKRKRSHEESEADSTETSEPALKRRAP